MRLARSGTVTDTGLGCATIVVSVPCATCRQGFCGSRKSEVPAIAVRDEALQNGDTVEISVSGRRLGTATAALFGPVLVWTLVFGTLAAAASDPLPVLGASGYALALALGSILGKRAVERLDVRVLSDVEADADAPGVS